MWFWLLFLHCYPSQLVQISLLIVNVSTETKTQINTETQQFSEVWSSQDAQEGRQQRNLVLFHTYIKEISPQGCFCPVFRLWCRHWARSSQDVSLLGAAVSPATEPCPCSHCNSTAINLSWPHCSESDTSLCAVLTLPLQPKCQFQPWICAF